MEGVADRIFSVVVVAEGAVLRELLPQLQPVRRVVLRQVARRG